MFPQAATSTKLGVYDPKAVRSPWTPSFQSLSSRPVNAPFSPHYEALSFHLPWPYQILICPIPEEMLIPHQPYLVFDLLK